MCHIWHICPVIPPNKVVVARFFRLASYGHRIVVAADADLSINLETMDGYFELTRMGYWNSFAEIYPGTGTRWGDGDLRYVVEVSGSTFTSVDGDDGAVEGIFVGSAHEGMAGTLKRNDLVGAFGGSR